MQYERETLSPTQKFNEYILTSLRTIWGCDLEYIKSNFGEKYFTHCLKEVKNYINTGFVENSKNILTLSDNGKLIADKIVRDVFFT